MKLKNEGKEVMLSVCGSEYHGESGISARRNGVMGGELR
jgi:hypothetical protein